VQHSQRDEDVRLCWVGVVLAEPADQVIVTAGLAEPPHALAVVGGQVDTGDDPGARQGRVVGVRHWLQIGMFEPPACGERQLPQRSAAQDRPGRDSRRPAHSATSSKNASARES
jgi:hypothetical protein